MARYPGGRASFVDAAPLADVQGGTLVLGTADGSITIPTNPRPVGALLHPTAEENFVRARVDASSETSGAYLKTAETHRVNFDAGATNLHVSVDSGAGTLYVTWLFAGSAA